MYCLSVQRRHFPTLRVTVRRVAFREVRHGIFVRVSAFLSGHISGAQETQRSLHIRDGAIERPGAGLSKRHPVHLDDFAVLEGDRLKSVSGFLDQVPAAA